jgi:PAS domain-containing protein
MLPTVPFSSNATPTRPAGLRNSLQPQSLGDNAVLKNMLASMDEGIAVFDGELRLVLANPLMARMLDMPAHLCRPGTRLEDVFRFNALHGKYGAGDADRQVSERLERARCFQAHELQRETADGRVLQIRGRPLPAGGFVTICVDITHRARAERALRDSKALLEATFEHIDQGISIVDANLVVVGMNRRYRELQDFPEWLC